MANITYDYPALKEATRKLRDAVEGYEANSKQLTQSGAELVEGNNAEGVKSTMQALDEKQAAILKTMQSALDQSEQALAMAKELHIANGGEE